MGIELSRECFSVSLWLVSFSNLPADDDYNYKNLRRRNTDERNIGIAQSNENFNLVGCWAVVFVFNMFGLPVGLRVLYPRNN